MNDDQAKVNSLFPAKATDNPNRAKTIARTNMKTAISLYRLAELVRSMDDRNMILIPIVQGSTNPINPKTNGSITVA